MFNNVNLYQTNLNNFKVIKFFSNKINKKKFSKINFFIKISIIYKLMLVSNYSNKFYYDLPVTFKKTRSLQNSKQPTFFRQYLYVLICISLKFKIKLLKKVFLRFDYINRLWYKQWNYEWWKTRKLWNIMKKKTFKSRIHVNFKILKYKFVIRNFKVVTKKKNIFARHFNLGFFFYEYFVLQKSINRFNRRVLRKNFKKHFFFKKKNRF